MKPMPILKKYKDKIDTSVLDIYTDPTDKRGKLVRDKRSFVDSNGFHHVHPLMFTATQVYIVCPHCGEIHSHGKAPGWRVPHCKSLDDYHIENWEGYVDAE